MTFSMASDNSLAVQAATNENQNKEKREHVQTHIVPHSLAATLRESDGYDRIENSLISNKYLQNDSYMAKVSSTNNGMTNSKALQVRYGLLDGDCEGRVLI